ncbi:helix-turn-helix transcriptional regulator [Chitinophaga solisilvae]|uniref:helix-turn-helix transcriptional regulator n=1 Tax=Chitinophaga solisilvae TaxID=1233460 RepID=UPI00136A6C18|nr:helix-turn-helix transcriptional regulator [Chitinophaga solisilvae]
MNYQEIQPGALLQPYVQHYYLFESAEQLEMDDIVLPGGHLEIIFNLGDATWKTAPDKVFKDTAKIELWGQITAPLAVRTIGSNNKMLGIKFYPHTAARFLQLDIFELNNQVNDTTAILGKDIQELHQQLLESASLQQQITLIEKYLAARLDQVKAKPQQMALVGNILQQLKTTSGTADTSIEHIARQHNLSTRYLHKLFMQYTGATPKYFDRLHRFRQSLSLIQQQELSLTEIGYEAGYFDQSHFIREFKSFTGLAPHSYAAKSSPLQETIDLR